jgi:hypothetical protein
MPNFAGVFAASGGKVFHCREWEPDISWRYEKDAVESVRSKEAMDRDFAEDDIPF